MNSYQDYSRKASKEPKKIPIGRFLIIALILFFSYKYFIAPDSSSVKNSAGKNAKESTKTSSAKMISSSSIPPEIKVSKWENDDGSKGTRVDYYHARVGVDELLDTSRIPAKLMDLVLLSYQACNDTSRVRVRFNLDPDLNVWSYECRGQKFLFTKSGDLWLDSIGCQMGVPCWGPLVKPSQLSDPTALKRMATKDLSQPYYAAYVSEEELPVYNPLEGKVSLDSTKLGECIILDYDLGLKLSICAHWKYKSQFEIGDLLSKGANLGVVNPNKTFYIHFQREDYSFLPKDSFPWPILKANDEEI